MNSFKKILVGLTCGLLPVVLITFGALMSTYQTLGNATTIKGALQESGIYSAVVEEGLQRVGEDASAQVAGNIPVDRPEVQNVIRQSIPPEVLEQQTNGAIDNFYAWLRGDVPNLQFEFNLSDAKTKLADGLAAHAAARMDSLPTCTSLDDVSATYDPFNAACVPKGLDKAAATQRVRDEIANNQQFLKDPVVTPQDVNANGQEVQLGNLRINRDLYEQTRTNLYLTGGAAVLLAAAIVFLSATRRAGARRLAIITIVVGGVSAVLAGVISLILNGVAERMATSPDANVLQTSIVDAVRLLTEDIRNWWLLYGVSLLATGVVILVILGLTRRKPANAAPIATAAPMINSDQLPQPQNPEDKLKYPRA